MASKKGQVVPTIKVKSVNISAANGETVTFQHATSKLVPLKEQGERQKRELVISLALLGHQSNSKERLLLLAPNADSSIGSYHRSPTDNLHKGTSVTPLMSAADSYPMIMQVMTTGATSIKEQLAQMNEAIVKLTKTVEEKDM
ncbi:dicarboxylate transporter 1 [Pyrus ussuriensis x Pyrus communis]|uniref:Dicarboxylate transporter 1 n=1 Tax=Pyrus ussuriensis x Pyrus communis TaxID=2448454 RepID=A0A5N5GQ85_9ROSA|nr:dicarboxylate transporter 1 [Pyrus ussuriensis x Pyrus communis]